jgi:hypothetical protein
MLGVHPPDLRNLCSKKLYLSLRHRTGTSDQGCFVGRLTATFLAMTECLEIGGPSLRSGLRLGA